MLHTALPLVRFVLFAAVIIGVIFALSYRPKNR